MFEVEEAQEIFLELIERVLAGEEILISRNGRPIAQLSPYKEVADTKRDGV
jgi:prevent-host-death family protein